MILILKDKGGNQHYVYHFVDPDLGVEIPSKKRANRKRWHCNRLLIHMCTLVL